MRKYYQYFLALGDSNYPDEFDKRRSRLFNFLVLWSLIVIFPFVISISIIQGNLVELLSTVFILLVTLFGLYLNSQGHNQVAVTGIIMLLLWVIWYVLYHVPYQTGAPYGNLLIALVSVLLIKKRRVRLVFLATAISSFIASNYIQLKYRTFSDTEYGPITAIILLLFLAVLYYDKMMILYQHKIDKQGKHLLKLEEEKHEKEIELRQKDLEMMLASASARDQLAENLIFKLKNVLTTDDVKKEIQRIIYELNSQNELISKQALIYQNIDELNADFFDRLLAQFPDLTKAERELAAYMKLSLSNKEIAAVKNSTENSVNVSKARLRKKLGIQTNKELSKFLMHF